MRTITWVALLTLASGCAYGQTADAPTFEVASIKPAEPLARGVRNRTGCFGGPGTTDPGTWSCRFLPLALLIADAYSLQRYQFAPPDWMMGATFDITAKVLAGTTKEQFLRMQQNLLAERFKLTLHHEQKEMPFYEMTVGKNGLKMKESAPDPAALEQEPDAAPKLSMGQDGFLTFPSGRGGPLGLNGHYRWTASHVAIRDLLITLASQFGRMVLDATGLKGKYDVDLYWVQESMGGAGRDASDVDNGPTLIRAIQEQLGLKLESKKGPVDSVVVDHAEKVPSEN
jgi:uncharacterized protein (TIGR03435 family)